MWTPTTRAQRSRAGLRYGSDLTDAEWAILSPFLPREAPCGRKRAWPLREIVNAICYVLRGGIAWRLMPDGFPPWRTVYRWFARLRDPCRYQGVMERWRNAPSMGGRVARILNPTLFSAYFRIDPLSLDNAGLIDPFIDVDTPLFIDPVLLEKSSNPAMATDAIATFRKHFGNFVRLITISNQEEDAAWKGAKKLLDLREPPENGLGFGGSGRSGNSRPNEVRDAIMRTAKEIVTLGSKDPDMISLMGFFEENVGPDTISDFTTRVIIEQLAHITSDFCNAYSIPLVSNIILPNHPLPRVIDRNGKEKFIVLVPKDIVRELPIARDWSDIEAAVAHNERIRQAVNSMLAGIAQPTVADRKQALRAIALQSPQNFQEFLDAVKDHVRSYDPNVDALAYYRMKSIFASGFDGLRVCPGSCLFLAKPS